ncbi:MAG: S41 family peptidase [candidate division Zixibacteria bacterium]|jgi:carboxyl-terminal processing protease|nr:S41 family peptidase [candidate division Zixibacteria bacterium]
MVRFTAQLFGVTLFALALIWFAAPGDAVQSSGLDNEPVLWADTVHINLNDTEQKPVNPELSERDTFLNEVKKLTQTAFQVRNNYMEDIDSDELIRSGIAGMLSDLDRFSVLLEKSAYDNLMESTHGKYEGLGMQIDARENHIVIISPIEGTPAYRKGLRAGDIIMEIDGQSTYDMESSDAAKLMRGEAGTAVKLTIKRAGLPEPLEFSVERAIIQLKSVNYAGVVPGTDIGYVRLSRFAEETSHELRQAISDLNERNVSGLIFDLRSNGGGLLDQAKETAELFLPESKQIVYTKGRFEDSERHYYSERPPLFPDKPLIILVDEGTASASEIVAGAIQDWDRGLIMGSTTYGKGLVQQIFPIGGDGSMALKLTTAKYYIPSGRCIQKPETQSKNPHREQVSEDGDEAEVADSVELADREVYYTNGGRIVYGGGGIVPDIDVERETWKPIEINLERKSMFFDFAIDYVAKHTDVKPDFEVDDKTVSEFRQFLKDRDFSYKSSLQVALEDMEKTINDQERTTSFDAALAEMRRLVDEEKARDFDNSMDYIKRAIKREVVSSIAGETGVYNEIVLKQDKAVQDALRLLQTPKEYGRLIQEGQKKAEL